MKRRTFIRSGAALTASMALLDNAAALAAVGANTGSTPANVYTRSLHITYNNGNMRDHTDAQYLAAFAQVKGGITAMMPFLLNEGNVNAYKSAIAAVQEQGTVLIPAVGKPPSDGPINQSKFKDLVKGYSTFTKYARLEGMQGYWDAHGQQSIQDMIDYMCSLGFEHIMLNPWPMAGDQAAPFKNPELDATFQQVHLDFNHGSGQIFPNPGNWMANTRTLEAARKYRPTINCVVNYESEPQTNALKHLSISEQEAALKTTYASCVQHGYHFAPPFLGDYDAIKIGTWPFIADMLSGMGGGNTGSTGTGSTGTGSTGTGSTGTGGTGTGSTGTGGSSTGTVGSGSGGDNGSGGTHATNGGAQNGGAQNGGAQNGGAQNGGRKLRGVMPRLQQ